MKKREFTDDVTILDRYQAFSAEILRLALLGMGVVGFFVTTAAAKHEAGSSPVISLSTAGVRPLLIGSLVVFGFATCLALLHRYYSTESMACHLAFERLPREDKRREVERRDRDCAFRVSSFAIAAAPASLAVGAALIVAAFVCALM